MRRGVLILLLAAIAGTAAVAQASAPATQVSPGKGWRTTKFAVSFVAPASTSTDGSINRSYEVSANGGSGKGCVSGASVTISQAAQGSRVRVTLKPGNGRWCKATFRGTIVELIRPLCTGPFHTMHRSNVICPMFMIAPRTIGSFSFKVR